MKLTVDPEAEPLRVGSVRISHFQLISKASTSRSKNKSLLCDADVLRLGKEPQRFFAAFAADAALFHAAERDAQVAHEPAIHPYRAGVNLFSDAMGAAQVLCPDAGGQAVIAIVRIGDHFVFVVEWRDRDNRAENFFAVCAT